MTEIEEKIIRIVESPVEALGYELVGIEFTRKKRDPILRIFIDHKDGITIDDCAEVSLQVGANLDVEDIICVKYSLEVSSPGIERPLFKPTHFDQFKNHDVGIVLKVAQNNQLRWEGTIDEVKGNTVVIVVDGTKEPFLLANIAKAKNTLKLKTILRVYVTSL